MAAGESLGRQFLDRHLVEHHGGEYGRVHTHPDPSQTSNESNNYWHDAEHEVMADTNDEHWGSNQVPHHHSPERIHFH
jgi:hypothetical protein